MASFQVGLSQTSLPLVGYVFTFPMLRSLHRVNVMANLVEQDSAEQD
jgi:hypothetical protein